VTPGQSPLSPTSTNTPISYNLTGLTGGTTYYFRVNLSNANGSPAGVIRSFTTPVATTTTTSTTSTTVAPIAGSSVSAVNGTVWIDTDGDETKDASEVWIPGISIAISGVSSGTATTSKTGAVAFSSLAAGSYKVKATMPTGLSLSMSWDSQGAVDWEVTVTVVAGQTARADFAARGNLEAVGTIKSAPPGTDVNIDWSGVDKNLDTPDDVTFISKVQSDQTFSLENIPSGKYRVRSQSLRTVVSVGVGGATYENSSLTFVVRAPTLPATGTSSLPNMIPGALAMVPLGALALLASRRRRTR